MLQIFQSTLPRVERQLSILAYSFPCQISIHAPASGATVTSVNIKLSFNISIHAPASGATVNILKQNPNKVYFNPRSREWSDFKFPFKWQTFRISIHAPASGATFPVKAGLRKSVKFQSTLPRVERRHLLTFFRLQYGYILFHLTNKYSFCF